ncbi:MAG: hypothetical protein AAGA54_16480 [Myxococcota bacterium]
MKLRWVAACTLLACSPRGDEPQAPSLVERSALQFADADEKARFDRAYACFSKRGANWTHEPLQRRGNFIGAAWCTTGPHCSAPATQERDGAAWGIVDTLHDPRDGEAPQAFGVSASAGERPSSGWAVAVSVSMGGSGILGDHASVRFERAGDDAASFYLGHGIGWTVAQSEFSWRSEQTTWAWLDGVRASPEALAEAGTTQWRALRDDVVAALDAGTVRKCEYGEYKGDGIPPACIREVPLTASEVQAERTRIGDAVATVERGLSEAPTLHARILDVASRDCI